MKQFITLIILCISLNTFAQTVQHHFNLGQATPKSENLCLVIKSNSKAIKKPFDNLISPATAVTSVKLIGFNDQTYSIDSLLEKLKPLVNLNSIIFENCDLSTIESSFEVFKKLEKISIVKQSTFDENTFFPLLKNNSIKELAIQSNDSEIVTDSLSLLTQIKSINVSSSSFFTEPNYKTTMQLKTTNKLQNIDFAYYGDLYKPNASGVLTNKTSKKTETQPFNSQYKSSLDCIKQPIPGININDTVYRFSTTQKAQFTYESGTTVSIDQNAFLNQNGTPYKGNVNLFYREFRNPVEIMLSGIPMTNMVNGEKQLFKSGGMYEVNAFDDNNNTLNLVSDTSLKINFVLTDTSQTFQFFSLNNDGSWATVTNSINTVPSTNSKTGSRAVQEYYTYLRNGSRNAADTTRFNARFYDKNYLYLYRKDNFEINRYKKNNDTNYVKTVTYHKKTMKTKALFKVKYKKQTKDKQIVFTIEPVKGHFFVPAYIQSICWKNYLYAGNLTKDEFKKMYNKKLLCWDVRTNYDNTVLHMDLKTEKGYQTLSGEIIALRDDKTYEVQKKAAKLINLRVSRYLKRDAKKFDKETRFRYSDYNNVNYVNINKNKDLLAYEHSKKWQNKTEKPMDFKVWKQYVKIYANQYSDRYTLESTNDLGVALIKSGLGAKNIDTYLHNGTMQDILVRYNNVPFDSLRSEYNTVLFKNINTNYLLSASSNNALNGYQYKYGPNYIIRFSNDNTMQVTKANTIAENKKSNVITLNYTNQYNVKGLNSDAITKLILD